MTDRATPLILGFVGALATAGSVYRGRSIAAELLGGLSIALILIGLLSPRGSRAIHQGWMRLSAALGYINSRILLSIVYMAIVAPYGYVLRWIGRDPLNRRGPVKPTYWVPRSTTRQRKEQFERLF